MKLEKTISVKRAYFAILIVSLISFFSFFPGTFEDTITSATAQDAISIIALGIIIVICLFKLESYANDQIDSNIHREPKKGELIKVILKKKFTSTKKIKEEDYFYYLYVRNENKNEFMSSFTSKKELEEEKTYIVSSNGEFIQQN